MSETTLRPKAPFKKPVPLKGHEAFVKALEQGLAVVTLVTLAGEVVKGKIHAADKYTISLKITTADGGYQVRVFFKHALESFETNPKDQIKAA
jgi:sRNA-binding regulator protein Hfq